MYGRPGTGYRRRERGVGMVAGGSVKSLAAGSVRLPPWPWWMALKCPVGCVKSSIGETVRVVQWV